MTDSNTLGASLHSAAQRLPEQRVYDVVVLGAGPAGAIAAHCLARKGRDVLLVDRARFPRFKVCGGCLNERALAALSAADLGDIPVRLGAVPLNRFALHTARRTVDVALPGGIAVSRTMLDQSLVEAAQLSGAVLAEGISGQPQASLNGYWTVSISNGVDRGEVRARSLLIATGLGTKPIADAMGDTGHLTVMPGSRLGGGTVVEGADVAPGTIHMAIATGGYVGTVRMEDDLIGVAAAFDAEFVKSSGGLATAAAKVFEATGQAAPAGLTDATWRGTPLLTRQLRPVAGERYLIAGDAAGYVEPFTGEGMAWAMTAGVKAADLIDAGIERWPMQIQQNWETWYQQNVIASQHRCRPITAALRKKWLVEAGAAGLALMPFLARPVINALNAPAAS